MVAEKAVATFENDTLGFTSRGSTQASGPTHYFLHFGITLHPVCAEKGPEDGVTKVTAKGGRAFIPGVDSP